MAEDLAPHELIASDDYWTPESEPVGVPPGSNSMDGLSTIRTLAQRSAVEIQTLFRRAERERTLGLPIADEEQLPLMSRGVGLLRVVLDCRRVDVRNPAKSKDADNDLSHDQFDWLAQKMLEDPLYAGPIAQTWIYRERSERYVRLWRAVTYMTGSRSHFQLEGILSSMLGEPPGNSTEVEVIPRLVVGRNYAVGKYGELVTKVVAAQVVRPGISEFKGSGGSSRSRLRLPFAD